MTDFIVLTGFLGSGKTTLLADFLKLPEVAADTAVIVNEIGEIGLDGAILAEDGSVLVAMLANGCICCGLAGDLERTASALIDARCEGPPLARIVLETSGLSKPGPILRSLTGMAGLRLRAGVLSTVDCRADSLASDFEEGAAQWSGAHTLVLTRRDIASSAQRERARDAAMGINPLARIVDTADRESAVRMAFSFDQAAVASPPFRMTTGLCHTRIQVLLARPDETICWDEFAEWLDNLAGFLGERLLRWKCVMRVADRAHPVLVQSVGTLFELPRPSPFLVSILRDSSIAELKGITPCLLLDLTHHGAM